LVDRVKISPSLDVQFFKYAKDDGTLLEPLPFDHEDDAALVNEVISLENNNYDKADADLKALGGFYKFDWHEYQGQTGTVVGWDDQNRRWLIDMDLDHSEGRARRTSLEFAPEHVHALSAVQPHAFEGT